MTYSFTHPKHRPFFSLLDKIWLILFGFGVLFILAIFLIYTLKIGLSVGRIESKKQEVIITQQKIRQNNDFYDVLLRQSQIALDYNAENQSIKNSLQNLLDITLKTGSISFDSLEQDAHTLKITGVSPTKEMFAMLLETPLKSIFDESHTSYYKLDNGWYRFTSTNSILGVPK
ncbi:hypothetical protein [Campylobacter sp.]|uniref:hypothetical protein n=1 Tax=Campylobacter sp. TaxID=205 RepID=UPI0026DB6B27|nr:hypothetical protein [Campylobacter sp.]MDO4674244.1 hypothetical protein [Campylobacter sp.]